MQNFLVVAFVFLALQGCEQGTQTKNAESNPEPASKATGPIERETSLPLKNIKLPEGFHITTYAEGVDGARSMVFGDKGTLFVGTRGSDVYALKDEDNDGFAEKQYTIATGLSMPNGVAFKDGSLYVAEIHRVIRFDNIESNLANPPAAVVVNDKFPDEKWHGWKYMAFGPDGKLYVPVGAPCNVCEADYNKFENIMRMNADGSGLETYAKGVRNTVGFDWHPETGELWFTDNGRDMLGDDLPADELNHAPGPGMHFGFPYCHAGDIEDPKFGKEGSCDEYEKPALKLGPHVAALGMKFYRPGNFPGSYKDKVFIAEHGSWNRSAKIGYRIMMAIIKDGIALDYQEFATGWLANGSVWGRPVDIRWMPDGTMLVSDDAGDAIYRIWYK